MEEKRVADYFVVAGLPAKDPQLLEEASCLSQDSKETSTFLPITDVTVIIRSQGEAVPIGYHCIEFTPSLFPADLNHGGLRTPSVYLCYRRGRDKPPLVDIGVLCEAKERVMADSQVVENTPYGRTANINNSGSRLFLTYRRAAETAPCNKLVVTDICVILANKGETPPHAFNKIDKNLNKGMVGSDVFICYKKSMNRPDLLCYKPAILGRFPLEDYSNFPLPESVALFCLPMGATVECWPKKAEQPYPIFSTFVLTTYDAEKVYGSAVTFYEKLPHSKLTAAQRQELFRNAGPLEEIQEREQFSVHVNKSICLLSRWPFYDTFEKFLRYLHKMSRTGPHKLPIERYVSHFMLDIPFPSPQRPRILVQLTNETISLSQPQDTMLPLSGASFIQLLRNLRDDNCLMVLLFAMTEQKMLFHSLRPDVLTSVAEAVVMLMFPFHWQCPYIPLCPLGLSDVLSAPLPFLVGVDSRYFDLYDPPSDVICIDLDTNNIYIPDDKKWLTTKILPKRPTRVLRNTLQSLFETLHKTTVNVPAKTHKDMAPYDLDFRIKQKQRELDLEIQEAFLKFMAAILKDFRSYLLPITSAPKAGTTDTNSLFNFQGFLKSRDKTYQRFFLKMMKTQMFTRFIEERSFVSDKDASLAFFDECTEKVDNAGETTSDARLLEFDGSHQRDTTVFIAPPEPPSALGGEDPPVYSYNFFPTMKSSLFHRHPSHFLLKLGLKVGHLSNPALMTANSPIGRRTKQEIKSAQKVARKQAESPPSWAKCLLSSAFSLWFIHLPSYLKQSPSKAKALKTAFQVLTKMQSLRFRPQDEVCYRVLMLLCGQYSQPVLAVRVLSKMKDNNVQPNAITYGYYNKAVLESPWPSGDFCASLMWAKLRNVIIGVSMFKKAARNRCRRSRSLCSELDYDDVVSRGSSSMDEDNSTLRAGLGVVRERRSSEAVDGRFNIKEEAGEVEDTTRVKDNDFLAEFSKVDDQTSSGGLSDGGYSSMVQEDPTHSSNTRLSIDVSSDLLGPEEDLTNSSSNGTPLPTAEEDNALTQEETMKPKTIEKSSTVRSLRFNEIDFSDSDAFRCRTGSIVRNSASSLGNLNHLHEKGGVDSPAGVLITSHTTLLDDGSPIKSFAGKKSPSTRRRHKSAGGVGDRQSLRLYRSHISVNERSYQKKASHENDDLPKEFLRSNSFGSDAQILKKLREDKAPDEDSVTLFYRPISSVGGSDSGLGSSAKDVAKSIASLFKLSSFQEESEDDLDDECKSNNSIRAPSILPRPRSPNIPIKTGQELQSNHRHHRRLSNKGSSSSREPSEDHSTPERRNSNSSTAEVFSPLQDALEFFGTGGGLSRMATSLRHSFRWKNSGANAGGEKAGSKGSSPSRGVGKVTRSSTFHGPGESRGAPKSEQPRRNLEAELNAGMNNNDEQDTPIKSLPRSSTLPLNNEAKIFARTNFGSTASPSRLMSSSASTTAGLAKLASYQTDLVEGLKSAASTMATKINEIKQNISASATPTKGMSVSGSRAGDMDTWMGDDNNGNVNLNTTVNGFNSTHGSAACSASASRRTSVDYLSKSIRSDESTPALENSLDDPVAIEQILREAPWQRNMSTGLGMHTASVPLFKSAFHSKEDEEYNYAEHPSSKVAIEISISSLSRCGGCSSLLYDEEIMEGWSADESNLNTQCTFCKANFVPLMSVTVKDLRVNGSRESLLTPAISQESVRSLPQFSLPPGTPPLSVKTLQSSHPSIRPTSSSIVVKKGLLQSEVKKFDSLDSEDMFQFEDNHGGDSQHQLQFNISPLDSPPENFVNDLIDFGQTPDPTKPSEKADPAYPANQSASVGDTMEANVAPLSFIITEPPSEFEPDHPLSVTRPTKNPVSPSPLGSAKSSEGSIPVWPSANLLGAPEPGPLTLEPISVPYLSPLVLRKEVENILDHEGEDCLTKSEFVDQHPIIYWNLIWYFHRIGVPSHLPGLCLRSETICKGRQIPESWQKAHSRNVSVHCLWDNNRLHEDMGQPLYFLWNLNENRSSLVHALVTDDKNLSQNLMKQVLKKIQYSNDLSFPITTLFEERSKRLASTKNQHSIYRELLFLSLFALGQDNIDITSFDREYRRAFDQLNPRLLSSLSIQDRPPTLGAIFCRTHFKDLELKAPV